MTIQIWFYNLQSLSWAMVACWRLNLVMCYSKQIMVDLSSDSFWHSNKAKWNWEGNNEGTPWEKGFYFQVVYSISMGVKLSWLAWKINSQSCLLKYTSEFILLTYAIVCVCVCEGARVCVCSQHDCAIAHV